MERQREVFIDFPVLHNVDCNQELMNYFEPLFNRRAGPLTEPGHISLSCALKQKVLACAAASWAL